MLGTPGPVAALLFGLLALDWFPAAQPLAAQRFGRRDLMDPYECAELRAAYSGKFTFLRLYYSRPNRAGGYFRRGRGWGWDGWAHDCPVAERHLMTIIEELTSIAPNRDGSNSLAADDPEIFKYPVAYISEPGQWALTDAEALNLRKYLEKGGFLIVDDFNGRDWFNFEEIMLQVLPNAHIVRLDQSHEIFNSFFYIDSLDRLTDPTSYGLPSEFHGIFEDNDPSKRLMVIVNYNNDIGDAWEWSDTGYIPVDLTNEAYKLGINYLVYSMTH
ncbi:MAG: DUF4159 domain-containing protein [Gemmatimonadetes bacterium]|nr:DUF4159 domain-containing protein [Gemmatimonadota bacterium]